MPLVNRFNELIQKPLNNTIKNLNEEKKEDLNAGKKEYFPLTINEIKNLTEFSSPLGRILHYLKNTVAVLLLGTVRLLMSSNAAKHGGSTSSYFREKNIYKNVKIVTGELSKLQFDNYNATVNNTNDKVNNTNDYWYSKSDNKKTERVLKCKDNGEEIKAKTFIETTEIAIYRTEGGDLYGVNRGTFFNDKDKAILLYKHNSYDSQTQQELRKEQRSLFTEFVKLNR